MRLLFFTLLLSVSTALAQSPIAPIFTSTFESNYRAGQCGTNIMNLVKMAKKNGLDLSTAKVIQITNKLHFNFGMVGGFEARNYRFPPPTLEKVPYTDLRNWFHHIFLEQDGYIYDYDFGTEPRILQVAEYVEVMFLPNREWSMGNYITPRDERLIGYQVEIHTAEETLKNQPREGVILTLGQFLERFAY